jgi:hypothetical protein
MKKLINLSMLLFFHIYNKNINSFYLKGLDGWKDEQMVEEWGLHRQKITQPPILLVFY